MSTYDEELETEIDAWVAAQLDEAPELGEQVIEAIRRVGDLAPE